MRLLDWGANYVPLTLTGEPWRLFTDAFLHANWIHLLANLYMFVLLGGTHGWSMAVCLDLRAVRARGQSV
ncbi:rhomboid family intramembrane serine protease [Paraburkholderia sp. EG287A]|uniref:rhomboid family intramembrane serine protease n=1 Tax=unclassified Paraburkholderia TaxID=2615204 RepID=UPI0034D20068